ncbi:MAG: selenium metabolism-associated LysR family transcriptional regulator [Clostridia bacterium]|nr:selenium metabolism-associated LysR family transcriptional regulator [Clostridia bacterium]
MNFKQLEAFTAVVKTRSFSKAAQVLFLTQPTVSAHVSALEEELGAALLVRSTKNIYPSAAGIALYDYAQEILDLCSKARYAVQHSAVTEPYTLRLAASTIPAAYVLPRVAGDFHADYPHIVLSVQQMNSDQVARCVKAGEAELGMCGTEPADDALLCKAVMEDRLVIIAPNAKPYSELPRNAFPRSLLKSAPFILRQPGSGTRREAENYLLSLGISPSELHVTALLESTESIKQAVACGAGISILSQMAAVDLEQLGKLLLFQDESRFLKRSLYCVCSRTQPLSPAGELFQRYLNNVCHFL